MTDLVTDRDFNELMYHLDNLIRLDSSAGTASQASVVRYLAGVLAAEGVPSELVWGPAGALNLVARLSAHRPDQALIFAAPTDVAPADASEWIHPPFSATLADERIWGRGALEPKRALAMGLMLPIIARRHRVQLTRDLVLVATADGESDGAAGICTLVHDRPDLLRGNVCLSGPGGHDLHLRDRILVPIRVASLGFALVRVKVRRSTREAVFVLSDMLERIESGRLEARMCDVGIAFLSGINAALPRGRAFAMRGLRLGGLSSTILKALDDPELAGMAADMAHDTVVVTGITAGDGRQQIPQTAEAVLSLRVLPGRTLEDALRQLTRRLGEDVEIEVIASAAPVEAPGDHPFLAHLSSVVRAARPAALPVHYAAFAGPEPAAMAELGIPTFGFAPLTLAPGFGYRDHVRGVDEAAPVAGIREGFQSLAQAVLGWCGPTKNDPTA